MSGPPELPEEGPALVALRVFPKLAVAREFSLVLSAKEIVHRIDRHEHLWLISVDPAAAAEAEAELAAFAEEQAEPPPPPDPRAASPLNSWSLFLAGALLAGSFVAQHAFGDRLLEAGHAESGAILARGEWYRCVTALFLHGDLGHLLANLIFGFVFAVSLVPQFGSGLGWLLILLSGAAGNAINAWGYRGQSHASIGASTAVFGALGLLVASELYYRWAVPTVRARWRLVAPLGAGLALLAYLGVGDSHERIDFMAHCWGFVAGLLLGLPAATLALLKRPPRAMQIAAGLLAFGLPCACWWLALRG